MKRALIVTVIIALIAPLAWSEETRTLSFSQSAAAIERIEFEAGVGELDIRITDQNTIAATVILEARRGGFFSSKKKALQDIADAEIEAKQSSATLRLQINGDSEDRRFEERWRLEVPARMAFAIDFGVGDIQIRGVDGGIELDAGVSDILIEATKGSIQIDVGVGDVTVVVPALDVGDAECSTGVGDASIRVDGKRISGDGFVSHSARFSGEGPSDIIVDVGVGEAVIKLR